MHQILKRHSQSHCCAGLQIAVQVARPSAHGLTLSYVVAGDIDKLCIPPVTAPSRKDDLWRRTCFEAFVRASGAEYYEFNLAPTTEWAAYQFTGYRSGRGLAEIQAPVIAAQSGPDRYTLNASLQLDSLARLPGDAPWHLGFSAVIAERSGRISYWALSHPSGKPDFHHPASFAYEVFPTVQA